MLGLTGWSDQEVVSVLLGNTRAHEVRDLSGMSALAWAAGSGALGVIETMVARGGVLHLTDKRGETGQSPSALWAAPLSERA